MLSLRRITAAALLVSAGLFGGAACQEETPTCPVELRYQPEPGEVVTRITAVGDWNGWDPSATPLVRQPDGSFATTLELRPGEYAYQLVVNSGLILDPAAPLRTYDETGQRERSLLRVRDCALPSWRVHRAEGTAAGELDVEVELIPGAGGSRLDPGSVVASVSGGSPLTSEIRDGDRVVLRASGLASGRYTVRLEASDRSGGRPPALALPLWVEAEPFDWEGALIYQVVTDRFAPSGEPWDTGLPREEAILRRHGGDLIGLTEVVRSGYFEELGVGAIWISPLNDNPDDIWPWYMGRDSAAYHGYWPISAREVEPLIGGEEAVRELVAEAHARGLRVIVDVVPNHVHIDHPYYREHAHDDWFNGNGECVCTDDCENACCWAQDLDRCWFSEYLADLRWRNPVVAETMVADTLYWLEAFELDGLRIDAIPMMPILATRELVWEVGNRFERGPTDIHLLGETYTGRGDWDTITRGLGPHGLDGQFDFPLLWEIRRVLAHGGGSMADLDRVLERGERAWAEAGGGAGGRAVMSPFLGNHDVSRFISEAAGSDLSDPFGDPPEPPDAEEPYRRLLLAHALVLTLPGAPVLYYGDELGLPGADDPDNRRPMRFDEDLLPQEAETLDRVARLGRLRACLPALRRGTRQTVLADDDLYVYLRDAGDGAPAVVVLNRSESTLTARFDLPAGPASEIEALRDALGGSLVRPVSGSVGPLTVPALTAMVLVPDGGACASP